MRPEGEKREAKLSQLELLALGEAEVWRSLEVAHLKEQWSPPGCAARALMGSVLTLASPFQVCARGSAG